jgi:multidrug efflux pump subunit AcrB
MEELKNTRGVTDVTSNAKLGREEYKLDIDYKTLAVTGLTVKDVANTLRIAFDGVRATSVVKSNEEIDIRVRFPSEHRQDVRNVLGLQIRNREGKLVPIKSFAKLSRVRAETAIHHTEGDVTTTVSAQTTVTTVPQQVIDSVIKKFSPELKDYPGVSFSYGGEAEKSKESVKSLLFAFHRGNNCDLPRNYFALWICHSTYDCITCDSIWVNRCYLVFLFSWKAFFFLRFNRSHWAIGNCSK